MQEKRTLNPLYLLLSQPEIFALSTTSNPNPSTIGHCFLAVYLTEVPHEIKAHQGLHRTNPPALYPGRYKLTITIQQPFFYHSHRIRNRIIRCVPNTSPRHLATTLSFQISKHPAPASLHHLPTSTPNTSPYVMSHTQPEHWPSHSHSCTQHV